jgi:hypothetical protein
MWRASSSCDKYRQSHGETKQLYCDLLPLDRGHIANSAPYRTVPLTAGDFNSGRGRCVRPARYPAAAYRLAWKSL